MRSAAFFKARLVEWVPSPKTIENQFNIFKKMPKMVAEKNCLRFWDIFPRHVQNLSQNAREPVPGPRSELFERMSKMVPQKIVYASGTFWDVRCRMA